MVGADELQQAFQVVAGFGKPSAFGEGRYRSFGWKSSTTSPAEFTGYAPTTAHDGTGPFGSNASSITYNQLLGFARALRRISSVIFGFPWRAELADGVTSRSASSRCAMCVPRFPLRVNEMFCHSTVGDDVSAFGRPR